MPRQKDPAVNTLDDALKQRTVEGALWEAIDEGKLRCYACGHRCVIPDGFDGICRVRFNRGGRLYVPRGYVGGLQVDPVEKKPFFHAFPGAAALSFGMLGCDYHCSYCTTPQTLIATSKGPIPIKRLFDRAEGPAKLDRSSVRVMPGLEVYSHKGRCCSVKALFRHPYAGRMIRIEPAYLLPLHLTPEHEVLAVLRDDTSGFRPSSRKKASRGKGAKDEAKGAQGYWEPSFIRADSLTPRHSLAIPKRFDFSRPVVFAVAEILKPMAKWIRHRRRIDPHLLRRISRLTAAGLTSREIGRRVEKSASHVRHLRRATRSGPLRADGLIFRRAFVLTENGRVRLSKEHRPGIPELIPLDEKLAALLGYYAAEGCIVHSKGRVHSAKTVFSLGHHEEALACRISEMLSAVFGISPSRFKQPTTLTVVANKASVALLFESLCGTGARKKHLPPELFHAPMPVVEAFLRAYVEGDGHQYPNGMIMASTASRKLAEEVAWLVLKTGRFSSIRRTRQSRLGRIQGRAVRLAPVQYTLYWFDDSSKRRWLREDARYFYVPIQKLTAARYRGFVFNLEVEEDHSYLAQFVSTHNCQNWLTSQVLRDAQALEPPRDIAPEEIVALARRQGAPVMVSTYNEPLITSEWAIEVFSLARKEGITCGYVSNGNGTPEVLDYIRPYVDLYKVDLKGFREASYRALGGTLARVLDTIPRLHAMGFWLEIVTLLIPGFNDSEAELRDLTRFVASVSPDIPWHVTAFHQDYKMTDKDDTTAADLVRAAAIGQAAGLRFVYAGNLPGRVGNLENTYCPGCRALLIERSGYRVLGYKLAPDGRCPSCGRSIPGFWQTGWTVPEQDGGLPGRFPRSIHVPAARLG